LTRAGAAARRPALALAAALLLSALAAAPAPADHTGPVGSGFDFADDVAGTAFPGDNAFWAGTCDLDDTVVDGGGFGSPPDPNVERRPHCIEHGRPNPVFGVTPTWLDDPAGGTVEQAPSWRRDPLTQAGAHPDATVSFWMRRYPHSTGGAGGGAIPDGDPKDIVVKLPPGVVGDPTALPFCRSAQLRSVPTTCPPETQVGVVTATLATSTSPTTATFPVYNAEPRDGKTAELIVSGAGTTNPLANIPIVARVRTDGDFGVDTLVLQLPGGIPILGQTITIWGVPWAAEHDAYRPVAGYGGSGDPDARAGIPDEGLAGGIALVDQVPVSQEPQSYTPAWGPIDPFVWNPTRCGANAGDLLVTWVESVPWQDTSNLVTEDAPADAAVDGCADVPFSPSLAIASTTQVADAPSGLGFDLSLPRHPGLPFPAPGGGATPGEIADYVERAAAFWRTDPDRLAPSSLKDTVVTLPDGMAVNPSSAAGLEGCSDAQIGLTQPGDPPLFDDADPFDGDASDGVECPAGSKLGTIEVSTPVLEETLTGEIALGQPRPEDIGTHEQALRFRLFLVIRNRQRGVVAKVSGSAVADPVSGRLAATFSNNPELPLEHVRVDLKGGERGTLRMPQRCGAAAWLSTLTPWSALHGASSPVSSDGALPVSERCDFRFAPTVDAGIDDRRGGASGSTFSFTAFRRDGDQWIRNVTVKLPRGLNASLKGVPLCSGAQADAGACPAGSRIGTVDAAAGSGTPFVLERKGDAYLTEGYRGAELGLAIVVPVEAGPFRGPLALDPVVVRQALHVDRRTSQATVESDPLPQVWHGIPLALRRATVRVDRAGFMRNPTDCSPKRIVTGLVSAEGARAGVTERFQATACRSLRFKPRLALRLTGRGQTRTGEHPGVSAVLRQASGQAAIRRTQVRLPKTLALDPGNARALCEFADGTKPDLETRCPRGSIVGSARAVTPLLNRPLTGKVFFVKNVRTDPRTGNQIRTLPMIVVALRGEIPINLYGKSSVSQSGKLVNTFAAVPDAPVDRFQLEIRGGSHGILAVTRSRSGRFDLCRSRNLAEVDMDAQNRRRHDTTIRMKPPCGR